jgi:hypothetical protein
VSENTRLTTGNLWFAFPRIGAPPGGLNRIAFLMMQHRGMIELAAHEGEPFLAGTMKVDGHDLLDGAAAEAIADWIPTYSRSAQGVDGRLTWLTPHDERGWVVRLEARNSGQQPRTVDFCFTLRWAQTRVTTYEGEPLSGRFGVDPNGWGGGVALAWVTSRTEFALGIGATPGGVRRLTFHDAEGNVVWEGDPAEGQRRRYPEGLSATITCSRQVQLAPGESTAFEFFASIACDTKAACLDARTLREHGFERLMAATKSRLEEMNASVPQALAAEPALGPLARRNRLFCYFFSLGRTLDTEELCPVTSRSSDYYVCAAYWDRDSLYWSFPTILHMDRDRGAEVLGAAYGRQGRNIGIHSRFIDGSMYEPGFELDELCAPVLALDRYLAATDDWAILERLRAPDLLQRFERLLLARKHPQIALFSTDYLPTDDLAKYPYCIYDNVLVWAACGAMERIARHGKDSAAASRWSSLRTAVHDAIWLHGVTTADGEKLFAWCTDLNGAYELYDEPPGSLSLLPWYGFCSADDPVYTATLGWIYSRRNQHYFPQVDEIGCRHEPHPWALAVANGLLVPQRRESALALLRRASMDEGLACEAFHEETGVVVSGRHFATCAGFLANALVEAFSERMVPPQAKSGRLRKRAPA